MFKGASSTMYRASWWHRVPWLIGCWLMFVDGVNALRNAGDYKRISKAVPSDGKLPLHLAPGGGFAVKIVK